MSRQELLEHQSGEWILKLLSGPHRGAELHLGQGQYLLGSHDDCDLILQDSGLAAQHLRITLTSAGPELVAQQDAMLWCEAHTWCHQFTPQAFEVCLVGHTFLAFAPADTPWPTLSLPDPARIEALPNAAKEADQSASQQGGDPPGDDDPDPLEANTPPAPLKSRRVRKSLVPLLAALPLIILIAFQWRLSADQASELSEPTDRVMEDIILGLREAQVEHVDIFQDQLGHHWIQGYVINDETRRALLERFRDQPEILLELTSRSRLKEGVLQVLRSMALDWRVALSMDGHLILEGWSWDDERMHTALARIRRDVPGIARIENRVSTGGQMVDALNRALTQSGLQSDLQVSIQQETIGVRGELTAAQKRIWLRVKHQLRSRFLDRLQLRESLTDKPETKRRPSLHIPGLQLAIRAVSVGQVRYVTLGDGTKVFEGTRLASGHILQAIQPDKLIFKYRGHRVVHRMGGMP